MRIPAALAVLVTLLQVSVPAQACSCGRQGPMQAFASSSVVFAGKVAEVVLIDPKGTFEPRIVVRFEVARVWKGELGAGFTMHSFIEYSACKGFFQDQVQVGKELLVFADAGKGAQWKNYDRTFGRSKDAQATVLRKDLVAAVKDDATIYGTNICSGTSLWKDAGFAAHKLGAYRTPPGGYALKNPPPFDETQNRPEFRGIAPVCWTVRAARHWKELAGPPPEATHSEAKLRELGAPVPHTHKDVWWQDEKGAVALCRMPHGDPSRCDAFVAVFDRPRGSSEGPLSPYGFEADPCDPEP